MSQPSKSSSNGVHHVLACPLPVSICCGGFPHLTLFWQQHDPEILLLNSCNNNPPGGRIFRLYCAAGLHPCMMFHSPWALVGDLKALWGFCMPGHSAEVMKGDTSPASSSCGTARKLACLDQHVQALSRRSEIPCVPPCQPSAASWRACKEFHSALWSAVHTSKSINIFMVVKKLLAEEALQHIQS